MKTGARIDLLTWLNNLCSRVMSETKQFSVRGVKIESIKRFNEIHAETNNPKTAQTLEAIIENFGKDPVLIESDLQKENERKSLEIDGLKAENEYLRDQLKQAGNIETTEQSPENENENPDESKSQEVENKNPDENNQVKRDEINASLIAELTQSRNELSALKEIAGRLQAENEKLKAAGSGQATPEPINQGVILTGSEFIALLSDENFTMARKCRKWYIEKHGPVSPDEYPNHLINEAVPYYLKRNFENVLNPIWK